ncbi:MULTISPECIES: MFS transporter [Streptomyces]|uniref:MFS family permease n=1 Tax=Streptomyces stelliscabiei TaxID=146820 RepID=A0A8I0TM25_9ACTN|nr:MULTISPECIES: MFS transporter [Streptomyces]MBE1594110.1 MFS family permease [Streptomyces stelliscabiei]
MDEPFDARRADDHHPHPGRVVALLAVAGLGSSFAFTAITPIQAHLLDLFASGREETAWAVTATLLVAAVLTPISGRLAGMIGKRRVVLALLALLALGSVVVLAGAQELWMLVLGRGLQGATTGIIPVRIAILRDTVPARRLDTSIALMSATLGVGGVLGLPISAIVNQLTGWRWTFGATAVSRRSWWRPSPRARGAAADGSTPWTRRGWPSSPVRSWCCCPTGPRGVGPRRPPSSRPRRR